MVAYKVGVGYISSGGVTNTLIPLGTCYDIFFAGNTSASALDQITYGGTSYVVFKTNNSIPSGNVSLLVPMA